MDISIIVDMHGAHRTTYFVQYIAQMADIAVGFGCLPALHLVSTIWWLAIPFWLVDWLVGW